MSLFNKIHDGDGFKISTTRLQKEPKLMEHISNKNVHIEGSNNEKDDAALFELVIQQCSKTTEKLKLASMAINIPTEIFQVFPLLKEVIFLYCTIHNENIMQFNQWCPNLAVLVFKGVSFSKTAFDAFISSKHTALTHVKSLAFGFDDYIELTRKLLSVLNKKFPSLENLEIDLDPNDCFSKYEPEFNVAYSPMFFIRLKKLSVSAYGNEIDQLFDYMAISNNKLKELTFNGMTAPQKVRKWIKECKKLIKLDLRCSYLDESTIGEVHDMKWLTEAKIYAKNVHWEPEEIIKFASGHRRLRLLKIESNHKNSQMQFGDEFKKSFANLIKERGKLTILVLFHEGRREIKISESGFEEIKCTAPISEDDDDYEDDSEDDQSR